MQIVEDARTPENYKKDPSWKIRALFDYYQDKPYSFCVDILALDGNDGRPYLDPWGIKALRALQIRKRVLIAGARSIGKNFLLAAVIIWFLLTRPYCKIIVTAVKKDTLRDNVWAEVNQMLRRCPKVAQFLNVEAEKISIIGAEAEWWCVPRVAAVRSSGAGGGEKQAEGISGKYAPGGVLYLMDEMSGIPDPIIDGIMASAEGDERYVWGQFNPVRRTGRGADYFLKKEWQGEFYTDNVSYLDSHMTNRGKAKLLKEREIKRRGINSPYVRANILGQFPIYAQANVALPYEAVQLAFMREVVDDPRLKVIIGIDPARFGDDETVIFIRRGLCSLEMWISSSTSSVEITGRAIDLAVKYVSMHPQYGTGIFDMKEWVEFRVDSVGFGGAVVDELRAAGWRVAGVANNASATMPEEYESLGDELWMEDMKRAVSRVSLRCIITTEGDAEGILDADEILEDQLSTRTYEYTGKAQVKKITAKSEMKKRGLGSPDRADAAVLAFADGDKLEFGPEGQFYVL